MSVTPCAWACTDYDGRVGLGLTKEDAKNAAGEHCTEFFGLVNVLALEPQLLVLAEQLEAELDSGAKWTKAQHACSEVSAGLRTLAQQIRRG